MITKQSGNTTRKCCVGGQCGEQRPQECESQSRAHKVTWSKEDTTLWKETAECLRAISESRMQDDMDCAISHRGSAHDSLWIL